MPELPEVELISRSLDSFVKGRTIVTASLFRERLAPASTPAEFALSLAKRHINFVHRRGKHILLDLSGGLTLIVHLRMSGRFSLLPAERENPKFTHALFDLDTGDKLVFDDQRHFGLMKIVKTSDLATAIEIAKLAPEPFSEEFSIEYFRAALKVSKRSLKEFLIDQTKVCGLGNIYAAEAMFAAGAHPALPAHRLSKPKSLRLHESIRAVLSEAINYAENLTVDPENLEGNYFSGSDEPTWYVYDREGEPCKACSLAITRIKQAGRSTYYCRRCQRR
ncbi:MAG: bifunctional DNA-formamidopyrimidine glycosylase/DNA-(apurinic or apyrimidinic site) lyase [Pyrinomonadaceae bacterium]